MILLSNPSVGGTETFLASIIPYLEKHGVKTDVLNTWRNSKVQELADTANLNYEQLWGNSRHICFKDLKRIVRKIKDNGYDIVLGFGIRVSILLRLLKPFIKKTPVITGLRGIDKWRRWYHVWPDRLTQFACDMFVANSKAVAHFRHQREKTASKNMVVIKNGIDVHYFSRENTAGISKESLGLPKDKLIVTSVANLRYEKGYDFLIEVISKLRGRFEPLHFVWVGAGELKEHLTEKLLQAGTFDKVTMLGYRKDVRSILANTDIFALPSREEGMPRCLMEAMAMSLPCVATNVGGTAEVIEQGISGFLSDFGDVEAFSSNLKRLVDSAELRQKIAIAARKRIIDHFNIEVIAKQYIKLFELVAARCRDGEEIQQMLDSNSGLTFSRAL